MKERLLEDFESAADKKEYPACAQIINNWYRSLPEGERYSAVETIASLNLNQLLTGIFSGLAQKEITSISARGTRIDETFVAVCGELDKLIEKEGLESPFLLRLGMWGGSRKLRTAFSRAVQRGAIRFNIFDREIGLSADALRYEYLSGQIGSAEMYERLAHAFLAEHEPS